LPIADCRLLIADHWFYLLADSINCKSLNRKQSAIGNRQSAIGNQQSTISNQQSTINNQQSTINNQQSFDPRSQL